MKGLELCGAKITCPHCEDFTQVAVHMTYLKEGEVLPLCCKVCKTEFDFSFEVKFKSEREER